MKTPKLEEHLCIRDEKTPDFFHSLTESDIDIITLKLIDEPKGRFKEYVSQNVIRDFIVFLSIFKPDMIEKLHKYKNRKKRKQK